VLLIHSYELSGNERAQVIGKCKVDVSSLIKDGASETPIHGSHHCTHTHTHTNVYAITHPLTDSLTHTQPTHKPHTQSKNCIHTLSHTGWYYVHGARTQVTNSEQAEEVLGTPAGPCQIHLRLRSSAISSDVSKLAKKKAKEVCWLKLCVCVCVCVCVRVCG
jgi:hypothetical protein